MAMDRRCAVFIIIAFFVANTVGGTSHDANGPSEATRDSVEIIRADRAVNGSTDDSGHSDGGGERDVHWLGSHWYIFVVFLVILVVVFVFVCGCVLRRSKLGNYHLQMHHNSNRYSPHIKSLHYQVPTLPLATTTAAETQLLPTYHGRRLQESPIHSEDRGSFVTQHTNSSTLVTTTHSKGDRGPQLFQTSSQTATPPSSVGDAYSDSPWSFIQSVAKTRTQGNGREERRRDRGCVQNDYQQSEHHQSYYHRGRRSSHQNRRKNPLAKVNGITDDSETSLCSLPSTSGSMHSDHSNPSTNRSRSNMSSHSTVVEVNLHVRLSPDQLNRAKDVTMAALAESARQLAESAANLGGHNIHEEQGSTRSVPHSPCPPSRNPHRHPRHSTTRAPLTSHSLPPSTHLDRKYLLQSHSSSQLPPLSLSSGLSDGDCVVRPCPVSPHSVFHTINLDRKSSIARRYYPISQVVGSGCGTEDEGTIVSLDRNSSSSSCHCPSAAATFETGQRSILTQSPPGRMGGVSNVVSLDHQSPNGGAGDSDADVTVVSLDRVDRSDHRTPHRTSLDDSLRSHDNGRDCHGDHCHSYGGSRSLNCRPENFRNHTQQVTTYLNLDSPLEDTPTIKQSSHPAGNLYEGVDTHINTTSTSKSSAREDRNVVNGYSYHHGHIPLQHVHLVISNPPSPSSAQHLQQLQNISEQGESECFQSSDNLEVAVENYTSRGDCASKNNCQSGYSSSGRLTDTSKLYQATKRESVDCVDDSVKFLKRRSKKKRKKERQTKHKETREADIKVTSERGDGNLEEVDHTLDRIKTHQSEGTDHTQSGGLATHYHNKYIQPTENDTQASPGILCDHSLHQDSTPSSFKQHIKSTNTSPMSGSPTSLLDKAHSPPRSSSALSVSEPLSSTASGYAATGESGSSTCDVHINKEYNNDDNEFGPEFEDIQKALFEARSQFSYPLQRLLDQDYQFESSGLELGYPLQSHSQVTQSHSRMSSVQHIQSVDV